MAIKIGKAATIQPSLTFAWLAIYCATCGFGLPGQLVYLFAAFCIQRKQYLGALCWKLVARKAFEHRLRAKHDYNLVIACIHACHIVVYKVFIKGKPELGEECFGFIDVLYGQ